MWKTVFFEPASNLLSDIGKLLSNLVLVVLILIIGWLVAKLIQRLLTNFLKLIRIDSIADQIGANAFLGKGGIKYTLAELLGAICYWLALLIVLVVAVNSVGLTAAADLLNKIVLYIPHVIAAIIILALAMFVASFLSATVQTAAVNAGISQAKLLAKVVEVSVIIFAFIVALEELNIGRVAISFLVPIILGSLGLGFALAVGLGCKDLVGKTVTELVEKLKKK